MFLKFKQMPKTKKNKKKKVNIIDDYFNEIGRQNQFQSIDYQSKHKKTDVRLRPKNIFIDQAKDVMRRIKLK